MNIHDKNFRRKNQELIDRYVDRLKNFDHLIDDDNLKYFELADRESLMPTWIGRNMYYPIHRRDVLYYSKNDVKMSEIKRMTLKNFNIVDMKFERMLIKQGCIFNGMFKDTEFFRFCLKGRPGFRSGENIYQDFRNVVMNCKFVNCIFMNSYAEHTYWINCEFINCTFINSEICCSGSEKLGCRFENNVILNIRV